MFYKFRKYSPDLEPQKAGHPTSNNISKKN